MKEKALREINVFPCARNNERYTRLLASIEEVLHLPNRAFVMMGGSTIRCLVDSLHCLVLGLACHRNLTLRHGVWAIWDAGENIDCDWVLWIGHSLPRAKCASW